MLAVESHYFSCSLAVLLVTSCAEETCSLAEIFFRAFNARFRLRCGVPIRYKTIVNGNAPYSKNVSIAATMDSSVIDIMKTT